MKHTNSLASAYNKRLGDMIDGFLTELEDRRNCGAFKKMRARELLACSYIIVQMHKVINQSSGKEVPPKDPRYKNLEDKMLEAAAGGGDVDKIVDAMKVLPGEDVY